MLKTKSLPSRNQTIPKDLAVFSKASIKTTRLQKAEEDLLSTTIKTEEHFSKHKKDSLKGKTFFDL